MLGGCRVGYDAIGHDTAGASGDGAGGDTATGGANAIGGLSGTAGAGTAGAGTAGAGALPDGGAGGASSPGASATLCGLGLDSWTLQQPILVSSVTTPYAELDPYLTADGLVLYFNRTNPTSDIYRASRPDKDSPFGTPELVTELSTGSEQESHLAIAKDQLSAFFARTTNSVPGIWWTTRKDTSEPFGNVAPRPEPDLAQAADPWISADGLRLYFNSLGPPHDVEPSDIFVVQRSTTTDQFGAPELVTGLNSPDVNGSVSLTEDERIAFFSRRSADQAIYFATRSTTEQVFGVPQKAPTIDSPASEGQVFITADGCDLFFGSNRSGNWDLYRTSVVAR